LRYGFSLLSTLHPSSPRADVVESSLFSEALAKEDDGQKQKQNSTADFWIKKDFIGTYLIGIHVIRIKSFNPW